MDADYADNGDFLESNGKDQQLDNYQLKKSQFKVDRNKSIDNHAKNSKIPNIKFEENNYEFNDEHKHKDNVGDDYDHNNYEEQCYDSNCNNVCKSEFIQNNDSSGNDNCDYDKNVCKIHQIKNSSRTTPCISNTFADDGQNSVTQNDSKTISEMKIRNDIIRIDDNYKNLCSKHYKYLHDAVIDTSETNDLQCRNLNSNDVIDSNLNPSIGTQNNQIKHSCGKANHDLIIQENVTGTNDIDSHCNQHNEHIHSSNISEYYSRDQQYQNYENNFVDQTCMKHNTMTSRDTKKMSDNTSHNLRAPLNATTIPNDNYRHCETHRQHKNENTIVIQKPYNKFTYQNNNNHPENINNLNQQNNKPNLFNRNEMYDNQTANSDVKDNFNCNSNIDESKYFEEIDHLNEYKNRQQCSQRSPQVQSELSQQGKQSLQANCSHNDNVRKSRLTVPKIDCNHMEKYAGNNTSQQEHLNQYIGYSHNHNVRKSRLTVPKIDCNHMKNYSGNNTSQQEHMNQYIAYSHTDNVRKSRLTVSKIDCNQMENYAGNNTSQQESLNRCIGYGCNDNVRKSRLTVPKKDCNQMENYAGNNTSQQENVNQCIGYDRNASVRNSRLTAPKIDCEHKEYYAGNNTSQQENLNQSIGFGRNDNVRKSRLTVTKIDYNHMETYAENNTSQQENMNQCIGYGYSNNVRKTKLTTSKNEYKQNITSLTGSNISQQGNHNMPTRYVCDDNVRKSRLTVPSNNNNRTENYYTYEEGNRNTQIKCGHNDNVRKTRLTVPNNEYNRMEKYDRSQQGNLRRLTTHGYNNNVSETKLTSTNYNNNQSENATISNTFEEIPDEVVKQDAEDQIIIFGGVNSNCTYCEEECNQECSYPISQHPYNFYDGDDQVLYYTQNAKKWSNLSRVPGGSRAHHVVVTCNGLVYLIGGATMTEGCPNNLVFEKSVWSYNPNTFEWFQEVDIPELRRDFAAVAIDNIVKSELNSNCSNLPIGIFVIGGEDPDQVALNTVWFYNIERKVWHKMPSLSLGCYGLTAVVFRNEIWTAGGITQIKGRNRLIEKLSDAMECIPLTNIKNRKWVSSRTRLRIPRVFGRFCKVSPTELLLIGGLCNNEENICVSVDLIDFFNPNTKLWEYLGNLTIPRYFHDVVLDGDRIIIIGGVSSGEQRNLSEVESYYYRTNEGAIDMPALPWGISACSAIKWSN
ncbi:GATA zinc finger domain-containing protein 14-like [Teleopsis dalmanni]|uniref:GATA zinc finger domain-containing protein 14-like n=1 Tax=Teleopsis dalmanni TaxID=139649 RepID=UPI0018CFDAAB|nr:GATA zinc finger domain-containing protein 14-like [Teleopsis dalmanni]